VRRGFYRRLGAKSVAPGLGRVTRRCDGDGAGRDRANESLQRDDRRVQTAASSQSAVGVRARRIAERRTRGTRSLDRRRDATADSRGRRRNGSTCRQRARVRAYVGACDNSEQSVHVFVVGRTCVVIIAWCDRIFARGASGTRLAGTGLAWTTVALFVSRMYPR